MPIYKMTGKKNGKQRYRVRINYTDNYGKAHQTDRTVYGLEEAKMLEYQLTNDIKRKKETPAAGMTISDLYDEYINAKRYEVRETTLDKSVRIIARYIIPECGSTKLSKFNVASVQKWKMYMEGLNVGITTKRNVYGVFHAMVNYAVKMEYMSRNVLEQVGNFKAPLDNTATKEMQYYTADEFKRFIAAVKSEAEEAGVKVIKVHDFRHSHVSLLANENINIQEIARRLGHAKISMNIPVPNSNTINVVVLTDKTFH